MFDANFNITVDKLSLVTEALAEALVDAIGAKPIDYVNNPHHFMAMWVMSDLHHETLEEKLEPIAQQFGITFEVSWQYDTQDSFIFWVGPNSEWAQLENILQDIKHNLKWLRESDPALVRELCLKNGLYPDLLLFALK